MTVSDLLILYCPGSRGDFLAAVLLDLIDQHYQQYCTVFKDPVYTKLHSINQDNVVWGNKIDVGTVLKNRSQSIRIKLAPEDYTTVARLAANKGLRTRLDGRDAQEWENQNRPFDIKFGHVVWFQDLFDIKFLQDFYQRFNGRPMPDHYVPMIRHNIRLQFNYRPLRHRAVQSDQRLLDH